MKKKTGKRIRADYQAKNLKNPFYRSPKKERTGKWRLLIRLFIFLIILALIWFVFAAPFLIISKIELSGLERVDQSEIIALVETQKENKKLLFFKESNFFLFNKEGLINKINDKYNFSSINISKKLPNTLLITISERPYSFIFQEGTNFFYASADGYVIKDEAVKDEDKNKYFILENRSQIVSVSSRGKINIKADYLEFVFAVKDKLAQFSDLVPDRFIIEQELNSLLVDFKDGPVVYFNVQKDPELQVEDLALVKREKIRDNFSITNYIDLRYGEMIYIN